MTAEPETHEANESNQGVASTAPAEGADDAPGGGAGSPEPGVITGETADER